MSFVQAVLIDAALTGYKVQLHWRYPYLKRALRENNSEEAQRLSELILRDIRAGSGIDH